MPGILPTLRGNSFPDGSTTLSSRSRWEAPTCCLLLPLTSKYDPMRLYGPGINGAAGSTTGVSMVEACQRRDEERAEVAWRRERLTEKCRLSAGEMDLYSREFNQKSASHMQAPCTGWKSSELFRSSPERSSMPHTAFSLCWKGRAMGGGRVWAFKA